MPIEEYVIDLALKIFYTDTEDDYLTSSFANTCLLSFGNNWNFNNIWRTSTVVALASQMYESRNFSAMPILGDALQDAGCDEHWLTYLRDTNNKFFRGSWILDQILGK